MCVFPRLQKPVFGYCQVSDGDLAAETQVAPDFLEVRVLGGKIQKMLFNNSKDFFEARRLGPKYEGIWMPTNIAVL
jgi:hypothetical protein